MIAAGRLINVIKILIAIHILIIHVLQSRVNKANHLKKASRLEKSHQRVIINRWQSSTIKGQTDAIKTKIHVHCHHLNFLHYVHCHHLNFLQYLQTRKRTVGGSIISNKNIAGTLLHHRSHLHQHLLQMIEVNIETSVISSGRNAITLHRLRRHRFHHRHYLQWTNQDPDIVVITSDIDVADLIPLRR